MSAIPPSPIPPTPDAGGRPDCSELAKVLTKLAFNIAARPGMGTLDAVTAELQKHIPEITRAELVSAIAEATAGRREVMSEAARRVADVRREARNDIQLRRRIAELEQLLKEGKAPRGGPRPDRSTEVIKKLREIRDMLRKKAGPSEYAQARQLERTIADLNRQIRELEGHLAAGTRPAGVSRNVNIHEEVRKLRERRDDLQRRVGPSEAALVRQEERTVAELQKQIEELETHLVAGTLPETGPKSAREVSDRVKQLRSQRDDAMRRLRQSEPARRARLAEQLERLAARLEHLTDVPTVTREDLPVSKELERMMFERDKLQRRIRQRINELRPKSFWTKYPAEGANLARAIMTSFDISAVLRQGGFITIGNPAKAARAFGPMLRAWRSEQAAYAAMAEIDARPNAPLYARTKLALTEIDGPLNKQEEAVMSRLAGKIPGVAASQRAYTVFLNRLRADVFDAMVETLGRDGEVTLAEAKALANYINVATGRGGLGKAEQAAETLATVFFAPRLVASRFQLVLGQPFYGGTARTRKLIAQEYAKFLTGIGLVYLLSGLMGAELEFDPRSSDFGKIKVGNTRIDPLAGISQVTVLMLRLATGEKKLASGRVVPIRGEDVPYGSDTSADLVARFLRSKLSPLVGWGVDVASGRNVVGEPVDPVTATARLFIPLSFQDILETMEEHGVAKGAAISILNFFGWSVQTYGGR